VTRLTIPREEVTVPSPPPLRRLTQGVVGWADDHHAAIRYACLVAVVAMIVWLLG
jgi:hypothetical protein